MNLDGGDDAQCDAKQDEDNPREKRKRAEPQNQRWKNETINQDYDYSDSQGGECEFWANAPTCHPR